LKKEFFKRTPPSKYLPKDVVVVEERSAVEEEVEKVEGPPTIFFLSFPWVKVNELLDSLNRTEEKQQQ